MAMQALRVVLSLAIAFPLPAFAGGGHHGHDHTDGTSAEAVDEMYRRNPDMQRKQNDFERRLKQLQAEGGTHGPRPEDAELDPEIRARILDGAMAADEQFMADLIAERDEEKAQLVEENIWASAEALATPETQPIYRTYLRRVYFYGQAKDGDAARHIQWVKSRLETPFGWRGSFPTLKLGPLPPGIAGLWQGGAITLLSLSLVVLSHEWHHHTDGANGMDGESKNGQGPKPEEIHAYDQMGHEI